MTNEASPWSNQPAPPPGHGPAPGWAQPGPASVPPTAAYGQAPAYYPGPSASAGYAPGGPAYGPAPGYPPPFAYGPGQPPVAYAVPLRTDYASWGRRVGANLIDFIPSTVGYLIFLGGYIYWLVQLGLTSGSGTPDFATGLAPMLVGLALMLASIGWTFHNRWVTAGRTGQSVGKRVTKIRLISEQTDAPIGAMNAFVRDLVHILDSMSYVGYLWPLWDDKRQTFADKLVKTIVVNAG